MIRTTLLLLLSPKNSKIGYLIKKGYQDVSGNIIKKEDTCYTEYGLIRYWDEKGEMIQMTRFETDHVVLENSKRLNELTLGKNMWYLKIFTYFIYIYNII